MKKTIVLVAAVLGLTVHAQSWNLTGNAGTNSSSDFVGTTDNQSLTFKVNNNENMRMTPTGRFVFYGIDYPGQIWGKSLLFGGGVNNSSGNQNTVFGIGALTQSTGSNNVAIGGNAMSLMTSGDINVAVGVNSMRNTESGSYNTAVGMNAMEYLKSGSGNVGIGHAAMGSGSLIGSDNVAVGTSAGRYISSGTLNVILGSNSFRALSTGSNNISVGSSNARNITSGNNNIFIGTNITPYNTTSPDNELNIGNWIVGNNGTIGIGGFTNQLPADGIAADGEKYKLFVKNGIRTEKVKVDIAANNGWADYVFEKNYRLMPLNELAEFIETKGHLPEVPTTEEAIRNGIELKEMNILLLKKIEELTLHLISQDRELKSQKQQIQILKKQINLSE